MPPAPAAPPGRTAFLAAAVAGGVPFGAMALRWSTELWDPAPVWSWAAAWALTAALALPWILASRRDKGRGGVFLVVLAVVLWFGHWLHDRADPGVLPTDTLGAAQVLDSWTYQLCYLAPAIATIAAMAASGALGRAATSMVSGGARSTTDVRAAALAVLVLAGLALPLLFALRASLASGPVYALLDQLPAGSSAEHRHEFEHRFEQWAQNEEVTVTKYVGTCEGDEAIRTQLAERTLLELDTPLRGKFLRARFRTLRADAPINPEGGATISRTRPAVPCEPGARNVLEFVPDAAACEASGVTPNDVRRAAAAVARLSIHGLSRQRFDDFPLRVADGSFVPLTSLGRLQAVEQHLSPDQLRDARWVPAATLRPTTGIWIELSPEQLRALDLDLLALEQQLRADLPRLGAGDDLETVAKLEVWSLGGRVVRLGDVAQVTRGALEHVHGTTRDGLPFQLVLRH